MVWLDQHRNAMSGEGQGGRKVGGQLVVAVAMRWKSFRRPAWISQCAPTGRFTSGGRFHPASCRLLW